MPSTQPANKPSSVPSKSPSSQPSVYPTLAGTTRILFSVSIPLLSDSLNVSVLENNREQNQAYLRSSLALSLGFRSLHFNTFQLNIREFRELPPNSIKALTKSLQNNRNRINENVNHGVEFMVDASNGIVIMAEISVVIQRIGFEKPSSAFGYLKEKIASVTSGGCNSAFSNSLRLQSASSSTLKSVFSSVCVIETMSPNASIVSSTYVSYIDHSRQPSSEPSSMPSCGVGSTDGGTSKCLPCEAGTYSIIPGERACHACPSGKFSNAGATSCIPCAAGSYSQFLGAALCDQCELNHYMDKQGAEECLECPYPSATPRLGEMGCKSLCVCINLFTAISVFVPMATLYLWCIYVSEKRLAIFVVLIFPVLDVFSDIAYVLTEKFYNTILFGLSIVSLSHAFLSFAHKLFSVGAIRPRLLIWNPNNIIILSYNCKDDYVPIPTIKGRAALEFKNNENLLILFIIFLCWVSLVVFQVIYLVLFVMINSIYLFFLPCWFTIGVFFKMTKLLALREVWNYWFSVWLGNEGFEYLKQEGAIDTSELNIDLFQEFFFETIPQVSSPSNI